MTENVDREQLYEEVWTTPLTTLCKSYGLSYAGMRRLCSELDVPVPQRGHWARVAAGEPFVKPALPARDVVKQALLAQARESARRRPSRADQPLAESASAEPPERPLHRAIQPLQRVYRAAEKEALELKKHFDWEQAHPGRRYPTGDPFGIRLNSWEWFCEKGEILCATSKKSVLRVSIRTYKRALRLLSDLAFRLEAAGFRVKLVEDHGRLEASRAGVTVRFRMSERLEPSYVTAKNSWNGSERQEKVLLPTEILTLYVERRLSGDIRFDDAPSTLLEDQWPRILEGVERQHATAFKCCARREEERRIRDEQERLRLIEAKRLAEIRAREEAEAKRRGELAQEAGRWSEAERIRGYVSSLEASAEARGLTGAEMAEWIAWARAAADLLDPSPARLQSWAAKPEAGDAD